MVPNSADNKWPILQAFHPMGDHYYNSATETLKPTKSCCYWLTQRCVTTFVHVSALRCRLVILLSQLAYYNPPLYHRMLATMSLLANSLSCSMTGLPLTLKGNNVIAGFVDQLTIY